MSIFRLATTIFSLTFLVACGGGGGSTVATPTAPTNGGMTVNPLADLTNFVPTENSLTIQAVQGIAGTTDASIVIDEIFEAGSLDRSHATCIDEAGFCQTELPGNRASLRFSKNNITDISLVINNSFFSAYNSEITNGIIIEGITYARGNLIGTRMADNTPVEFQTFAGWLDGSIFGITQIEVGESGNEQYRFGAYHVGVPNTSNPTATESEATSATWAGVTVATIKTDRTFIRGDATITIPDLANADVDLEFDNWRNLDNQQLSSMQAISYEDLMLTRGRFSLVSTGQVEVRGQFYGTGHMEVGGYFNTMDVTGAFGGTRQ